MGGGDRTVAEGKPTAKCRLLKTCGEKRSQHELGRVGKMN